MKGSHRNDSQEEKKVMETFVDDNLCQAGMRNLPPKRDFASPLTRKPKYFLISQNKA